MALRDVYLEELAQAIRTNKFRIGALYHGKRLLTVFVYYNMH